jgi:AcrR family transcriptional regulator
MPQETTKKPRGRPREFSTEDALTAAMLVFAKKGFQGASLIDLTKAMGINRTSMYATFGNKEQLFRLAMEQYSNAGAKYIAECFATGTAREGVARLLHLTVVRFTDPAGPGVCLLTQGPLTGPCATDETRRYAVQKWAAIEVALRDRFDRAIETGELPRTASTESLARFYAVVIQGLALQAQRGGTQQQLIGVVELAMASYPVTASKRD